MTTNELKPCKCGFILTTDSLPSHFFIRAIDDTGYIKCPECELKSDRVSDKDRDKLKQKAIAAWNKRVGENE